MPPTDKQRRFMAEVEIAPQSWVEIVEGSWMSQPACYQIEHDMQGDHHALITRGFTAMEPIGCNTIGTYGTLAKAKSAVRRHYVRDMVKRVRLSRKEPQNSPLAKEPKP